MDPVGLCCAERALGFRKRKKPGNAVEDSFPSLFAELREGGVEPPRRLRHRILNPARLPISPLSRFNRRQIGTPEILPSAVPQIIASRIRAEWWHINRPISTPGSRRTSGFARTGRWFHPAGDVQILQPRRSIQADE